MKKVLVVAEKPFFIDLLAEHGANTGLFGVLNAENSAKAVAILESIQIDVLVADLELPDVDGFELLLSVSQRFPTLPIVGLTAASQRDLKHHIETSSLLRFHSKPVNLELLINEVCDAMDNVVANAKGKPIELSTTLQLLEACRRTCMLRIKVGDSPAGFFYFREGVLFQAISPSQRGEEALQQLLQLRGVTLGFTKIPDRPIPRGIDIDVTTILRRLGILHSEDEDDLDAAVNTRNMKALPSSTSRFTPLPEADDVEEAEEAPVRYNRRATDRLGGGQSSGATPRRVAGQNKRSALEEWQESTGRRAAGPLPPQRYVSPETDDSDDLLEVLGAPPRDPRGAGPFVRGRSQADAGRDAEILLPPEDSALTHDIARGPRPPSKVPPAPPPLKRAAKPVAKPATVEIIPDIEYLPDEAIYPPDLPGIEGMTPVELLFDPPPIELEIPPPPPELGMDVGMDSIELLDAPPPIRESAFAPAMLPPVSMPPPALEVPVELPEPDMVFAAVPPYTEVPAVPAFIPAPTVPPAFIPAPPVPPAFIPAPPVPAVFIAVDPAQAVATPASEPVPVPEPVVHAPVAPKAVEPPPKQALTTHEQKLVARVLAMGHDVVGYLGMVLVSSRLGPLFSNIGPMVATPTQASCCLGDTGHVAATMVQTLALGSVNGISLSFQKGKMVCLPLRALASELPKREAPASLYLAMLLEPDGEAALAFHRLRQCELVLIETLQESQEEASWQALL